MASDPRERATPAFTAKEWYSIMKDHVKDLLATDGEKSPRPTEREKSLSPPRGTESPRVTEKAASPKAASPRELEKATTPREKDKLAIPTVANAKHLTADRKSDGSPKTASAERKTKTAKSRSPSTSPRANTPVKKHLEPPIKQLELPMMKKKKTRSISHSRSPVRERVSLHSWCPNPESRQQRDASDPPSWQDADKQIRHKLPCLKEMPLVSSIPHGLNGGHMRGVYLTDRHKVLRSKAFYWPQRPPAIINLTGKALEKRWRVDIGLDTMEFLKARDWPSWQPDRANVRYEAVTSFELPLAPSLKTSIVVSSDDSLNAALRMLPQPSFALPLADIPLVLNMAHSTCCGGGFLHGARAQEEDLCRRTDLFMSLQRADYPLPEFGCNYTFPVSILRGSKNSSYQYLRATRCPPAYFHQIGVLSAAAYEEPVVNDNYRRNMAKKIDALLTAAWATGHQRLVLSAWGCGAFKNPPEEVSKMFNSALRGKFSGRFKEVIFALDTESAENDNARAFCAALNCKFTWRPTLIERDPVFVESITETSSPLDESTHRRLFYSDAGPPKKEQKKMTWSPKKKELRTRNLDLSPNRNLAPKGAGKRRMVKRSN